MHERTKEPTHTLVSAIEENDTVIETIYRPEAGETLLVVAHQNQVQLTDEWLRKGMRFVPVRPQNNLIKHGALLLPSDVIDYGTAEELLGAIEQYIGRYVSLPSDAAGLSAAYVLLSWVYDAFNELPYLRFRGDYGTGKTRALLVIGALCHKAFFASGASTVSPIFHTLDLFKGTLIFDEADFRFSDEKAELVKILNNGNVKGFPVLRTQVTPQKEFDPRAFAIFGPKIVGMRRSYEDRALESRFLTVEMEPGRSGDIPINLPDSQKDEALVLRNKLLMYRFRNRLSVRLMPELVDSSLEPRMNQILLPLLSVAPTEELRQTIRGMARAVHAGIISDRSESAEGQVVRILHKMAPEPSISLAVITKHFIEAVGSEYERPITNRWVASILKRLGITLYKSNGVSVFMPGQEERIAALGVRYGVGGENAAESSISGS